MAMEQKLCAQVIMIRPKYLKFFATDKNRNEAKFKFQGRYARSQRWLGLDLDWIEVNVSTCEPDFCRDSRKTETQNHT